jgi:hypothetical protein
MYDPVSPGLYLCHHSVNTQVITMKKLFLFFVVSAALWSCQEQPSEPKDGQLSKPESPADSLFHLVMEGHDEAMAKMGRLSSYAKIVQHRIDSLGKTGKGSKKMLIDSLKNVHIDLKAAEGLMNEWMESFNMDSAQSKSEAALRYLEDQEGKVTEVKKRMTEVVAKADSILKR